MCIHIVYWSSNTVSYNNFLLSHMLLVCLFVCVCFCVSSCVCVQRVGGESHQIKSPAAHQSPVRTAILLVSVTDVNTLHYL